MSGRCPHNMGSYKAEAVENGRGVVIAYHYRCNGCHIILSTR